MGARKFWIGVLPLAAAVIMAGSSTSRPEGLPYETAISLDGAWQHAFEFEKDQAFSVSVRLADPGKLPANARIEVAWQGPELSEWAWSGDRGSLEARATANWRKVLHALDPDLYLVYKAPKAGSYTLKLRAVTDEPQPPGPLSHDTGLAPLATPLPATTPAATADVAIELQPIDRLHAGDILLEAEPNDTPEQAVPLPFRGNGSDEAIRVVAGADDGEYFNNARSGVSGEDWYRIDYRGSKPKWMTANLQMVEPVVSARIRVYQPGEPAPEDLKPRELPQRSQFGNANPIPYVHPPADVIPGPFKVFSYFEGRDLNERAHQQDDNFRSLVVRELKPGGTYYLRVEANQPGYEMEVRLFDPAPYKSPEQAIRQAIYYHLAEVDAWLIHRPRNIAHSRRVRDGTSLFGENCMSCHTQSGVWGVADAFRNGYRAPDGAVQNHRRLVNTMYESLRPTIKLEDAASNTSLAPNDLGDAPAGSRVAGRNIVLHERTFRPKKLQSYQQRRTANYVLQTADPAGINAAGKGSNFGPNVVFKFAAEILERAWRDTADPKYFWGLEEKAKAIVATGNDDMKVSDDLGHRIEFFYRLWPKDYLSIMRKLDPARVEEAEAFQQQFEEQVATDMKRLLALQQADGSWGFDLGSTVDGKTWKRLDEPGDPAATAVALLGLQAAGRGPKDPAVRKAVQWMLAQQYPYGLWNVSAQTGFVTTAYAIRALSLLYPAKPEPVKRSSFEPKRGESLLEAVSRVRRLQAASDPKLADLLTTAAEDPRPQVRYYGLVGLGGALAAEGVPVLIRHLDDPVKACREAAFWSLRQLLLDDKGWPETLRAWREGNARTRQSVLQALVSRADLSGPQASVDQAAFAELLASAMQDPFGGVRAYAYKAAWRWWVWNPPLRDRVNRAWLAALERPEPEAQVEMSLRYSTASFLITNGQIANQTGGDNTDQQYPELAEFYRLLAARRESAPPEVARRLDRRLTAVAASHFEERGNDGGPGQLGYSTPGASEVIGKAVLATYEGEQSGEIPWRRIALEGAANVNYEPLEQRILTLLMGGELDLVATAARALSNPRSIKLPATPDNLRALLGKLDQFLSAGRKEDAQALANFLGRVGWDFAEVNEEQEAEFFRLLISGGASPAAPARSGGGGAALKPAPEPSGAAGALDDAERRKLLGQVLGRNETLHRKVVFDHVSDAPELWLESTEWMLNYQEGQPTLEEAVEGATEAEKLKVLELTFGRTTEQIVPNGLASRNTILWWREGLPGARLTFALEAPEAGRYELIAGFLYDRDYGIVQLHLNGHKIGEPMDFYRPDLSGSGPVSLGVHDFEAGENRLTVEMLGANPEAERNYVFALDYVKLAEDTERGSKFTKDERGIDVIDPVTRAKDQIVEMFTRWFTPETPEEVRRSVIRLANKTALRRNPEVRIALANYVEREPVPELRQSIQTILNNDDRVYGRELRKLIEAQGPSKRTEDRKLEPTDEFITDILWFRDYVFAELNKVSSSDAKACVSCHSVPGRVPPLYLDPPDSAGYIAPDKLLDNYRRMQTRVDLTDIERSKFLRKPLNVQTGKEDGHQGGARYTPDDPGYHIIREWVLKQAELQK